MKGRVVLGCISTSRDVMMGDDQTDFLGIFPNCCCIFGRNSHQLNERMTR